MYLRPFSKSTFAKALAVLTAIEVIAVIILLATFNLFGPDNWYDIVLECIVIIITGPLLWIDRYSHLDIIRGVVGAVILLVFYAWLIERLIALIIFYRNKRNRGSSFIDIPE